MCPSFFPCEALANINAPRTEAWSRCPTSALEHKTSKPATSFFPNCLSHWPLEGLFEFLKESAIIDPRRLGMDMDGPASGCQWALPDITGFLPLRPWAGSRASRHSPAGCQDEFSSIFNLIPQGLGLHNLKAWHGRNLGISDTKQRLDGNDARGIRCRSCHVMFCYAMLCCVM